MSAKDNLHDEQFVTVYRGRPHYNYWSIPKTEDKAKGLGMHWTTNLDIARHFAGGWNIADWGPDDNTGKEPTEMGGHVLYGRVHRQHIVEPHTPEWKSLAYEHAIMEPEDNIEEEVTIREHAPIELTGVEIVKNRRGATDRNKNYKINKIQFKNRMGRI